MRLIVAGGREFNNYKFLSKKLDRILSNTKGPITIISGGALGADKLGEDYAEDNDLSIVRMPAEWGKYGKSAGYKRNKQMAEIATHCVCFWDGESKGTKHMIDIAKAKGLPLRVVKYKKPKKKASEYFMGNPLDYDMNVWENQITAYDLGYDWG